MTNTYQAYLSVLINDVYEHHDATKYKQLNDPNDKSLLCYTRSVIDFVSSEEIYAKAEVTAIQ